MLFIVLNLRSYILKYGSVRTKYGLHYRWLIHHKDNLRSTDTKHGLYFSLVQTLEHSPAKDQIRCDMSFQIQADNPLTPKTTLA